MALMEEHLHSHFAEIIADSAVTFARIPALELRQALEADKAPDHTLSEWILEQTRGGLRLARLGEQMERAFVRDAPDFSTMTGPRRAHRGRPP